MTKLEELKAAYYVAWGAARDAWVIHGGAWHRADTGGNACAAAEAFNDACVADWDAQDAWAAYQEELKKSKENSDDH
jgi:hypothetical protein